MKTLTRLSRTAATVHRLEAAKADRDDAIRQARHEGYGPNAIAEATGLSRQQVWNILKTPPPSAQTPTVHLTQ